MSGATGRCEGTGAGHQAAGSSDYSINIAATGTEYPPDQQPGWCLCSKCLVLNHPASSATRQCAATGANHDNSSADTYWLQSVPGVDTLLQTAFQSGVRP